MHWFFPWSICLNVITAVIFLDIVWNATAICESIIEHSRNCFCKDGSRDKSNLTTAQARGRRGALCFCFCFFLFFYLKPSHFNECPLFKMDSDWLKFTDAAHDCFVCFPIKKPHSERDGDRSADKKLNSKSCSFHCTPFPWGVDDAQRCLNSRCFMEGNVESVGGEMTACRTLPVKIFSSCLHHISVYQPCFSFFSISRMNKCWQHLNTHSDKLMHKWGKTHWTDDVTTVQTIFQEMETHWCLCDWLCPEPSFSLIRHLSKLQLSILNWHSLNFFFSRGVIHWGGSGEPGRAGMFLIFFCSLKPSAAHPQSPAHLSWIPKKHKVGFPHSHSDPP